MIARMVIEAIKATVDLAGHIESKGIRLRKKGKNRLGICPFHPDTDASLSVNSREKLWNCFGCAAGGDVIAFEQQYEKIEFPEAVRRLCDQYGIQESSDPGLSSESPKSLESPEPTNPPRNPATPESAGPDAPQKLSAGRLKLFQRVIEFYHTAFSEDDRARQYLGGRGIRNNEVFAAFRVGFANGALLNVLPDDGGVVGQLKDIGILNAKGNEHFYGCAVFPLYDLDGHPAGMYGRRIPGLGTGCDHLYLPGPRRGVFNWQAAKSHKEIILSEAVIDALTLIDAGIGNAIPCYGTNGLTPAHLSLFRQYGVETAYVCFDADDAGAKAQAMVCERLREQGLRAWPVCLPAGQDINAFFSLTANPGERFLELVAQAKPNASKAVKEKNEGGIAASIEPGIETGIETGVEPGIEPGIEIGVEPSVELSIEAGIVPTDTGFTAVIDGRDYEIIGVTKGSTKLKATVKGIRRDPSGKRFHVDTVDFYSSRSRAFLIRGLSDLFGVAEAVIGGDVNRLLEIVQANSAAPEKTAAPKTAMSRDEIDEAMAFLKNPDLLDEIVSDFETLGSVGEETNKQFIYIAAVSRKTDYTLSVAMQGRSGVGKSHLQDIVLSVTPEEDYDKYTRLTDQALFYEDSGSLAHRIMAIEELDGMNGAMYSIRSMQSSKRITIAYTAKDPVSGRLKTEKNTVEGPLVVFLTTTKVDIDGETASRFVFLPVDESEEMTVRILEKQKETFTVEGMQNSLKADAIIRKHKNAQRLLKPLGVIDPYARLLTFNTKSLRARRDHIKYQSLILAITLLFQYQRKARVITQNGRGRECVITTLQDIAVANKISGEVFGRSLDELNPSSRNLLKHVRALTQNRSAEKGIPAGEYRFNRRDLREYTGWSDFQIRTHIKQLEDLEYIYPVAGKRGKEYVYELIYTGGGEDGQPFLIGLIDIPELQQKALELGICD